MGNYPHEIHDNNLDPYYQYSKNPFSHLATASWQPFDYQKELAMKQQKDAEEHAKYQLAII